VIAYRDQRSDGVLQVMTDTADPSPVADDPAEPPESVPGDGLLDPTPVGDEPDDLQTSRYGREHDAAQTDTSESSPRPRETPAD
jgi:hypothetical protein